VYAGSAEIKAYFQEFAIKYDLNKYISVNHQVTGAVWDDGKAKWTLEVRDYVSGKKFFRSCDILINASGILNNYKFPSIPGLNDFSGKLLHSANYDTNYDLTGKHVGVIGNGYVHPSVHVAISLTRRQIFWDSNSSCNTSNRFKDYHISSVAYVDHAFARFRAAHI
jgi:hypothetical protein